MSIRASEAALLVTLQAEKNLGLSGITDKQICDNFNATAKERLFPCKIRKYHLSKDGFVDKYLSNAFAVYLKKNVEEFACDVINQKRTETMIKKRAVKQDAIKQRAVNAKESQALRTDFLRGR